jgi:hypothetical protein
MTPFQQTVWVILFVLVVQAVVILDMLFQTVLNMAITTWLSSIRPVHSIVFTAKITNSKIELPHLNLSPPSNWLRQ